MRAVTANAIASIAQTVAVDPLDAAQRGMAVLQHMIEPVPLHEYHEDMGPVTWWTWDDHQWLGEPAYIGTPTDSEWPGYHTHFTPHPPVPTPPTE